MSALSHAPQPLRLKVNRFQQPGQAVPVEYGGANFRQATFAEVKDFFDNPNASRANASNPFYVMQANLYVTQVSPWPERFLHFADPVPPPSLATCPLRD
jgi:hypothetical protein